MASERSLTTPVAVLIGSVIIALAVLFGPLLRPTPTGRPAASAPARTAVQPPLNEAPPAGVSSPAGAVISREAVTAEVVHALEQSRKQIIERCWKPAALANPEPPMVKLTFNFTFDPAGQQAARGAREARGASRPEIRECLDDIVKLVTISPPGAVVQVEVPFTLP